MADSAEPSVEATPVEAAADAGRSAVAAPSRPVIAITMGDPCGVGPETIAAAWSSERVRACCRPIVVGHPEIMRRAVRLVKARCEVVAVASVAEALSVTGAVSGVVSGAAAGAALSATGAAAVEALPAAGVLPAGDRMPCLNPVSLGGPSATDRDVLAAVPGAVDARGGQAAYDALCSAARLALSGEVAAVVTAPLNKAALWQAGHHYPGHTELLAELCGVRDYAMMLYLAPEAMYPAGASPGKPPGHPSGLAIVHVTLHMALREVFGNLSRDAIVTKIRLVAAAMQRLGSRRPRIGVCALNPHAGEQGLFGDEEQRIIAPAVAEAVALGHCVAGPIPADTLILRAWEGEFDAVVAMYHDQGHIAMKLMNMHRAVNVTLGLPIVRTSVAHGTALDLAWQGKAQWRGMEEAIVVAARLAQSASPAAARK
jgi:4-hydroxythreonine-4-phosphate dehydrogenase